MKKAHLVFNGLGAGNIGDEAMFAGLLNSIGEGVRLTVEVYDKDAPVVKTLPPTHEYISHTDEGACLEAALGSDLVLLAGDTPIMEDWGLDWPMNFHAGRLGALMARGVRVHAVGVGVDRLKGGGRAIFRDCHIRIADWTVRSKACMDALVDLGAPSERVRVGADFAWLFEPDEADRGWARGLLAARGVDLSRPAMGINVVNERWQAAPGPRKALAYALSRITAETGVTPVFLCNETREGGYYDIEAARAVAGAMGRGAIVFGNDYFTPSQMTALLSHMSLVVSQRYHFTVMGVLSGAPVASFARGQKLETLLAEFGEAPLSGMEDADGEAVYERLKARLEGGCALAAPQQYARRFLAARARRNLFYCAGELEGGLRAPARLASTAEIGSRRFGSFMSTLNGLARLLDLREYRDWSKVWEYPWLWFNGLSSVDWAGARVVDLGSELSPMPWFLASLGASVTIVESDGGLVQAWERVRARTGLAVDWRIVEDESLPFGDATFDVAASFSVIEHQRDKQRAVSEVARVLKPGGLLAVSFDICEPSLGMSFPEWNGRALTLREFEDAIYSHPAFSSDGRRPEWNMDDIPGFIEWHLKSASHHNYTVGASVLRKAK
jgi:SAM-dependent methyltransferase/polysaccharide pyruvyl transferase WcaK-like protein